MQDINRTPLYERHAALGGRIVDFGGWALPVQYSGILDEHAAVRGHAGVFDVSHMGEVFARGPGARAFLNRLVTNDVSGLEPGRIAYSPMCYENGGVVDDLLVYCLADDAFLLVINAANEQKDWQWMLEQSSGAPDVKLQNASKDTAQIALQGPNAREILSGLCDPQALKMRYYRFKDGVDILGTRALVSRTGYTGEDGYEVYLPPDAAPALWDALVAAGAKPCGLGARDTLRFEAAMPLYGHELSADISPLEAGLSRFVKLDKPGGFTGHAALREQAERGAARKLIGLEMLDKGIARAGCEVYAAGAPVGSVTSGSFAPTLGKNLAMALVSVGAQGDFEVLVRNRRLKAGLVPLPFYKR